MTIDEVIVRLQEYRDILGGATEVRLMTQENWPFENGIAGLASLDEIHATERDNKDEKEDEMFDPAGDLDQVVYLIEGQQMGYGTKWAWPAAN
jgi:hypothetical protein